MSNSGKEHSLREYLRYSNLKQYLFSLYFLFLFKHSCLHPHPTMLPHSTHPCLAPSNLPLLALSMCPLYMFLDGPSPVSPHYPFPLSPLVTLSLFFISVSLVIFCLLVCSVDQVPLIGNIIWYLSFTTWLISLNTTITLKPLPHILNHTVRFLVRTSYPRVNSSSAQ